VVGHLLAVVGVKARMLELIDTDTLRPVASVAAVTGPSHIEAYGRTLYVVDTGGGAILVYDLDPRLHQVARLPLSGSPLGLAIDPVNRRLFVTLTADNSLVEFDLSVRLPTRIAALRTVRQPDSVAVDPASGRVFVAGAAAGVLEIIPEPDTA